MTRVPPTQEHPTAGAPWTLIGPGCLVRGDLILTGNVLVHGRVEGTLFTDGAVQVAPEGGVEGGVHARTVEVSGSCRGRVEALEWIRVCAGATVHAEVAAPLVDIHDRARFFGHQSAPTRDAGKPDPTRYGAAPGNA